MLEKVISGGQIGADIAGLKAARRAGIKTGGYAPKGWLTKKGPQPELLQSFGLVECKRGYSLRTSLNVFDSDCTIRIANNFASPGERCTLREIKRFNKPYYDINMMNGEFCWFFYPEPYIVAEFLSDQNCKILNIAGNAIEDAEMDIKMYLEELFRLTNGQRVIK